MNKFEFLDKLAAELAAIEHVKFDELTFEAKARYATASLQALAALEQLGIVVTPPDGKHYCLWCQRELPFPATIHFVARGERYICHHCIKHLHVIVTDQEKRHPEEFNNIDRIK